MRVTTMPDTNGVMIRVVYFSNRLMAISTGAAAMVAPNIAARPPLIPAPISGAMK